jgi:hypothetical protein
LKQIPEVARLNEHFRRREMLLNRGPRKTIKNGSEFQMMLNPNLKVGENEMKDF